MQAPVLDIDGVSRFARIGCLKQLPVVAAIPAQAFLSHGKQRIISRATDACELTRGRRQCSPVTSDDQNDPPASICGGAFVLERNIVSQTSLVVRDGSKVLSRSMARCNQALEQLLAPRLPVCSADTNAVEAVRRIAPKAGTIGEENRGVKLYARLESTQAQDSRATFTECYAVLAKIRDGTPGKGDGS